MNTASSIERRTRSEPATLLDDALATSARRAAERLSRPLLSRRAPRGISLERGDAGLAITHAALEETFPGAGHAPAARRSLERAVRRIERRGADPSFLGGYCGVGWTIELLASPGDEESPIDRALAAHLASVRSAPFDLLYGLVGVGVYALERMPRRSARALVSLVVDRLQESAVRGPDGLAWRSDPSWVAPDERCETSEWNLGVAHGTPGVVAFLARVARARVPAAVARKARALLREAVEWTLARDEERDGQPFSYTKDDTRWRAAWCYGDPGVASALMLAGRLSEEPSWIRAATRIGLRGAALSDAEARAERVGLCHGSAGLAHLYHRLYDATKDARFAAAARHWLVRTLDRSEGHADLEATPGHGWLEGAGGVVLALLAATGDASAGWDRALLLSARDDEWS